MKRNILLLVIMLSAAFVQHPVMAAGQSDSGTNLPFKPVTEQGSTKGHPMKPAYSPIYGVLTGEILSIYSQREGVAEITVADSSGRILIVETVDNLVFGYSVRIADGEGYLVSVSLNGITYSATF